jgi:hypothetical protein
VRAHTHLKKSWKCPLGHIYTSRVQNRTQLGAGCPFCSGREALEGFNDLVTTAPEIAKEAYGWNPKMYTREALSNNPVQSDIDFDLLEVGSFSADRVPLSPDSIDSR